MGDADLETAVRHRPGTGLAPDPALVPGFLHLQLIDTDELGPRYRAEEELTGLVRTIRILGTPLSPLQRHRLDALWGRLARRPLHPSLATVVAYGTTPDGAPWVATDSAAEESLASPLLTGNVLDPSELQHLAGGLAALHLAGMVHGGIGPGAIVREGDEWRLTDVGIAAVVLPLPPPDSRAPGGQILAHAAPEVLAGADPGPAADVFALGLTLAEAIAGRAAGSVAAGETAGALLRRRLLDAPAIPDGAAPPAVVAAIRAACRTDPDQRPTATGFDEQLRATPSSDAEHPRILDDDVHFTVYRPAVVQPEQWYKMLAFAHKGADPGVDTDEPAPLEEVKRRVRAALGDDAARYASASEESSAVLERGSEITFVPHVVGVEFEPPSRSFRWVEAVHEEEFRLRAARSLDGEKARGRLSVFVGNLLVADVNLTIRVDSARRADGATPTTTDWGRPYRKIFASYSRRDISIVEHMAMLARGLGDEFIVDCTHLRAGEDWNDQLKELIRQADVFQLFWSTNSMASRFVRQEWEFALSLGRDSFVRPCYWEEPLPARPEENLPPETLQRLHFQQLWFDTKAPARLRAAAAILAAQPTAAATAQPAAAAATQPAAAATGWPPPPAAPATPTAPPPWSAPPATPAPAEPPPPSRLARFTAFGGATTVAVMALVLIAGLVKTNMARQEDGLVLGAPPAAETTVPPATDVTGRPTTTATATGSTDTRPVPTSGSPAATSTAPAPTQPPRTTTTAARGTTTVPGTVPVSAPPTTKAGPGVRIVEAKSDVPSICVAGKRPDTARVAVSIEHADQVAAVTVTAVQNQKTSSSAMAAVPAGEWVAGLAAEAGSGTTVFAATLGPFAAPGPLTWTVEATTRGDQRLTLPGPTIQVLGC